MQLLMKHAEIVVRVFFTYSDSLGFLNVFGLTIANEQIILSF